jgi:hypothetical protein
MGLILLFAVPYLDQDMNSTGVWFRSTQGRYIAGMSFLLGILAAAGFVILDEIWLDLPTWLPFLPTAISNGWVPLAALILLAIGYVEGLKALGARICEARQGLFTLLFASFVTLTAIGIFFRGEGMALIIPWS